MKHLRLLAVLVAMMIFATACGGGGASPTTEESEAPTSEPAATTDEGGDFADWPDELVIGFVPSREADTLVENIDALTVALSEALSEEAGREISVEGVVPTDYTGLVAAMETGQADVGAFGPFSLIQAVQRADAEIILQSVRRGSPTYHTQFFTNNPDKYCEDEPVENERLVNDEPVTVLNCNGTEHAADETATGPVAVEQIATIEEGTTVSFVEQASASGYIFPATIFITQGIDPETGIEPVFAGGHDNSVLTVSRGDAEVGVSFDDARTIVLEENPEVAENVVVFAYGPEIPNDGWAVRGELPDSLKEAITQALLDYADTDEGKETLQAIYEIDDLVAADLAVFELVERAAEELGVEGD